MRRIEAGGSSYIPSPVRGAQRDNPASPSSAEQEGTANSVASSSSRPVQGRARAGQVHAKFMENRKKADEWWQRLGREGQVPMEVLVRRLSRSLNKEVNGWKELYKEFSEYIQRSPTNAEQTKKLKEYLARLALLRIPLKEALDDYDKKMPAMTSQAKACLAEFEALPKKTKDDLFRAQEDEKNLENIITSTKRLLLLHLGKKINTLFALSEMEAAISTTNEWLLVPKHKAVEPKMLFEGEFSDDVRRDANDVIAEYDRLSEHAKKLVAIQAQAADDCEMLLGWKNLEVLDSKDTAFKNDFSKDVKYFIYKGAHLHSTLFFFGVANNVVGKLRLLLPLFMHDNNGQQADDNLRNWHERLQHFIYRDFSIFASEFRALEKREEDLIEGKNNAGNSRETLSMGLQLIRQGQSQLEKMLRTCEISIEEYENMEGIAKEERVTSSMKALAESISYFLHSRERSTQLWFDKLESWDSFLPPELQANRTRQQQSQAQPSLPQDMHGTTDGIVIGRINQEGKLERLGNKEDVTDIYFKDDSGHWVKDYGDDLDPEQLAPAAAAEQTAKPDKSEQLMKRAEKIVDVSMRASEKARAEIAAIGASDGDYRTRLDKKIDSLNRALSNQSKGINKVIDILSDLMVMQAKDASEEDPISIVKGHLRRLKEGRKDVQSKLDQVRHEHNIHSHKCRDPNEANLMFLWRGSQVESVKKDFPRQQNRTEGKENDWLERYTVSIKSGPQGEKYAPWIVHAHYGSNVPGAEPERVHMKRDAEKDWGVDKRPYHSPPLNLQTFESVKKEAQKQAEPSGKSGRRRRR